MIFCALTWLTKQRRRIFSFSSSSALDVTAAGGEGAGDNFSTFSAQTFSAAAATAGGFVTSVVALTSVRVSACCCCVREGGKEGDGKRDNVSGESKRAGRAFSKRAGRAFSKRAGRAFSSSPKKRARRALSKSLLWRAFRALL